MFNRVFPYFHHPFWGTIFLETSCWLFFNALVMGISAPTSWVDEVDPLPRPTPTHINQTKGTAPNSYKTNVPEIQVVMLTKMLNSPYQPGPPSTEVLTSMACDSTSVHSLEASTGLVGKNYALEFRQSNGCTMFGRIYR